MFDILLLALFLILPKIGMFDLSLIILSTHLGMAFITYNSKYDRALSLSNKIIIMFVLIVLIYAFSVFSFYMNGGDYYDEQFLFKPFRVILLLFILCYIFQKRNLSFDHILKAIVAAALLNAFVVYLQYIDSFLGGAGDILQNPSFKESAMTPYRKAGLMSGFPVAGILSFCGSMIAFHFFSQNKSKKYLLLYIIIGITCFLTARTALFLFLLGTTSFLLALCFKKGRVDILLAFLLITCSALSYLFSSENDVIIKTRTKMFANVIHYVEDGNANDHSTNDLFTNHYVMPTEFSTLLIGNSVPPQLNIVNSDVSFFRITWNNGIFSTLLYVLSYLFMWLVVFNSSAMQVKESKLIMFILFTGIFISNFKGLYFFSRVLGDLIFMIFISCVVNEKKRSNG